MSTPPKVAVLLCGYGEIEDYQDFADYNERALRLLASKFIQFPGFSIPWIAKALEVSDRREWKGNNHYHSPHNSIFEAQRAGLESVLQEYYGSQVGVFKLFNFCPPFLPNQVLPQIRAQGYDHLVIFPLLVVDSIFTSGLALQQINEVLAVDPDWVKGMRYFPSFFDQLGYHQRMASHIEARLQDLQGTYAPSQIGIILLNHGSPHEAKGYETGIRESEELYQGVRQQLISRYPLISLGWMNHDTPGKWTTPDMAQAAQNLLNLGAKALVFAPIGFATENHETMLDVGYAIKKVGSKAECLHLDCLNEDPQFLRMAADWIRPLIDELRTSDLERLLPVEGIPNRNLHLVERLPAHSHHGHSHHGHSHHGHSHGGHGHSHDHAHSHHH